MTLSELPALWGPPFAPENTLVHTKIHTPNTHTHTLSAMAVWFLNVRWLHYWKNIYSIYKKEYHSPSPPHWVRYFRREVYTFASPLKPLISDFIFAYSKPDLNPWMYSVLLGIVVFFPFPKTTTITGFTTNKLLSFFFWMCFECHLEVVVWRKKCHCPALFYYSGRCWCNFF